MGAARWLALALAAPACAHAYSFFVHYFTRTAPWTPVVEKFDLAALQNKTVPFLISDQQAALASGDTQAGVESQIRLAARAWNDVDTSDLRIAFGGRFTPGAQHSGPVIEVVFGEVPPGLIAATSATIGTEAQPSATPGAPSFVPIIKSTVLLNQDLSRSPSWSEAFFLTVTHEFGHAVGLQHSFTSSVMATEVTRSTTKARPLALDDTVGVSLLYPARGVGGGSIAGRVTVSGEGANLASVVALAPDGAAISALTNPDGFYRIDGVPAGAYFVYAHPLPPRIGGETSVGGVLPPTNAIGAAIAATGPFETTFYPNVRTVDRASPVFVSGAGVVEGINFASTRRASQLIYGIATYSFPGTVAIRPAHLNIASSNLFAVLSGYGLTARATVAPVGNSLSVTTVKPYERDTRFVQLDFQFPFAPPEGARHLVFASDGDTYVRPAAVRVARSAPPSIASVQAGPDRSVVVVGANFAPDTQVLFDGVPGTVRQGGESSLVVVPPPAPNGHRASVVALNRDGQSSLFQQGTPAYHDFDSTGDWGFSISPSQLPAGFEGMVEVTGANAAFGASTQVSFGSATILVRRAWVVGTNRLLANIQVAPNTPVGPVTVTVANGLRGATLPFGFTVGPQNPRGLQLRGPVVDAATGAAEVAPGSVASARLVVAVEPPAASLVVSVNDRPAAVAGWSGGVLNFRVPVGLVAGAGVLKVSVGGETAQLAMGIDLTPPSIVSVAAAGSRIDAQRPARGGETLLVTLTGAPVDASDIAASRVLVVVGGVPQSVTATATDRAGGLQVLFTLDEATQPGNQSLTVALDGRQSAPFVLPVRGN
jgi:hypothetical protein